MIRYEVSHRTDFVYTVPVSISHHLLHLRPRDHQRQTVDAWSITLSPAPAVKTRSVDFFGNPVEHLTIQDEHQRLVVRARGQVSIQEPDIPDPTATAAWEEARIDRIDPADPEALEAQPVAYDSPMTRCSSAIVAWARKSFPPGRPVLEAAQDLNHRIFSEFEYDPAATTVTTPVDEVFRIKRGVCQDYAHLMLAALRGLGLPARYVSGYLLTYPPPGGEKLQGSDASHAWVSLRVPGHGWIDLDPTNDKIATTEHVTLAWGRDYGDVSPVRGAIVGGGEHEVAVAVDVVPLGQPWPGRSQSTKTRETGEPDPADPPTETRD